MKNKKVLFLSFTVLLSTNLLLAQTGNWKLAGNALNGTQKLGSTNNFSLDFITNNVKRMSLTNGGNLGIGTMAPLSKLHVQTGSSGISPFFQSAITAESSTNTYMNLLSPSASETGILFGNNSGNTSGGIIYNSSFAGGTPNAFQFRTNGNFPRMVLTGAGNVGIGTTTPKASLHIFKGSAGGVTPNIESPIVAEANGNSFINLLTPVANVSGILFGNNTNVADGGIVYGGLLHRMEFRTNGNITGMTLTASGEVGIGTIDPGGFKLKIVQNGAGGLKIQQGSNTVEWGISATFNDFLALTTSSNGLVGRFDAASGAYSALSDERFKTNIRPMTSVLEKINQLKPSTYQFKNALNKQEYDGFIAQDVIKIFPNLVSHSMEKGQVADVYTMNYSGFGIIAIKGIQELMKINEEKDAKINALQKQNNDFEKRIEKLEALMQKGNHSSTSSQAKINTSLTDALLEQNTPNPFTNTTTIHYALPQKYTTAQITITDRSGKTIKKLNISRAGKGAINVDASALSAGVFNYSLMVDGKLIATKQMVLTK